MEISLYNTLKRTKETFAPLKQGVVTMYQCGPTVYDTPHIGNYRTFVLDDIIRRVFEYHGYEVRQAMNITDVDDKTIRRSREEQIPLAELTQKYESLFIEGLTALNILMPQTVMRATDHIPEMIELIETLINKGVAYKAEDGVYMSISKVKDYGTLALIKAGNTMTIQSRVNNDEYDKESSQDFALWKFTTEADGGNSWQAPFGAGRPGWHIECSAMAMKTFGSTLDIHTGGQDLIFPHHTNEIAQSESATGQQFVRYWLHGAFVTMADEKMAKSKGNFFKLEELTEQMISPLAYRYWLLTAHYRSPVNFSLEAVQGAQNALIRLMTVLSNLPEGGRVDPDYQARFMTMVADDFNIPQALAQMWKILDSDLSDADKRATIIDMDRVFGLNLSSSVAIEEEQVPPEVLALAEARLEARVEKDWAKADALRIEIEERGFDVLDTDDSFTLRAK